MRIRYKKLLNFYNETTPEEKCHFLNMMAKDINIPVLRPDGLHCENLDMENPIHMNGTLYQLNLENENKTNINRLL